MKKFIIIALAATAALASCTTSRMAAMQQELDRYHRMDSLAYQLLMDNNVPDADGSDTMAEYLNLHK